MGPAADRTLLGRASLATAPITTDLVEWAKGIGYRWEAYGGNLGKEPTVFQRAGQITKEVLTGFGEAWNAIFARPFETGIGLMEGVQAAGEGSVLPDIENGLRAVLPHGWFTEYALSLNPLLMNYNIARAAVAPRSVGEKQRIVTANIGASRIAYSAWKDPSLRQEYIRRYMAGEDPYLLAKELQRPFAEMWGQLILDPTNAIMLAGFLGKFGSASKALRAAEAVAMPKEARALLDVFKGATTEAEAIGAGEKLIQMGVEGTARTRAAMRGTGAIHTLTSGAARQQMVEDAAGVAGLLLAEFKDDPERVLSALRAYALKAGGTPEEVMGAVAELAHNPLGAVAFSEAGERTGIVLRRMMSNAEGVFESEALIRQAEAAIAEVTSGRNPEALAELLGKKIDGAAAELYPTVAQRLAAGEEISPWVRHLDAIANARGPIGAANRFFGSIYMGLSPGYAVRNALTNGLHMFVDYGSGTFQRSPATAVEITTKWLGGFEPPALQRAITQAAAMTGTARSRLPFRRLADYIEKTMGQMVYGNAIERSMRSMMVPGKALPDLGPLLQAGMSPEAARYVASTVVKHYGDTKAAGTAIRAAMQTGTADGFRMLEFLRPADIRMLQQYTVGGTSLYERAMQILGADRSATLDDALRQITGLFDEIDVEAATAAKEAFRRSVDEMAGVAFRPTTGPGSGLVRALAKRLGISPEQATELQGIREFVGQRALSEARVALGEVQTQFAGLAAQGAPDAPRVSARAGQLLLELKGQEDELIRLGEESRAALTGTVQGGGIRAFTDDMERAMGEYQLTVTEAHKAAHAQTARRVLEFIDEVAQTIPDFDSAPLRRALDVLEEAGKWDNATADGSRFVTEIGGQVVELARPYSGEVVSTPAQYYAATATARNNVRRGILEGLQAHWGEQVPVTQSDVALTKWLEEASGRIAQARATAMQVANHARDFTLLNYANRRGIDVAMGILFPYQYWYSRTYINWMQRLSHHPEMIAAYAKYRRGLEQAHADAPEWYRHQINTNELFGLDSENPLWFNLEATLNPLNGLTGLDFNNADRRKGWFATFVDDLGKFGPSVWTPVSLAIATAMYMQGENDAAAAWAGRLIPQTASLKAGLSLLRGKVSDLPLNGEYDPAIQLFAGGQDPYERRRIARALGGMIEDGTIDRDAAADAARTRTGPAWDMAMDRAINQRAPGQLASFFGGVGFKARTPAEIQIDQFDEDYQRLLAMEPSLSAEEYRVSWDNLRASHPFMDALLIARKAEPMETDRQYAYNVISRIPPSHSDDYAELVGIQPELLSQFYEAKGHMESWSEGDRMRFMAGMIDLGAILVSPDDATRAQWSQARISYNRVYRDGETQFGRDIWDRVDTYLGAKGPSDEEKATAEAILASDPEIGEALDYKSLAVLSNPTLSRYYASLNTIEGYYNGQMWNAIRDELGPDIWDKWDEYYQLAGSEQRAYKAEHPELARYMEMKDEWKPLVAAAILRAEARLRDIPPELRHVELTGTQGTAVEDLQGRQVGYPQLSWDAMRSIMGESLARLVQDNVRDDSPLPGSALTRLRNVAADMGIENEYILLGLAERALQGPLGEELANYPAP